MADVTLPQLGETVTEGTITQWFKQVGDTVAADEPLFEVSTDKVDTEVPSPIAGTVTEIRVPEGDTVEVGTVVAVVGDSNEASATPAPEEPAPDAAEPEPQPEPAAEPEPQSEPAAEPEPQAEPASTQPTPAPDLTEPETVPPPAPLPEPQPDAASEPAPDQQAAAGDNRLLSPVVRRLVNEHGIDPGTITGTGPGGRITREDVLDHIDAGGGRPAPAQQAPAPQTPAAQAPAEQPAATEEAPPPAPAAAPASAPPKAPAAVAGERDTAIKLSKIRRLTGDHMVMSKATSPHAFSVVEVDFANVDVVRSDVKESFKQAEGFSLTYLPFITRAIVDGLAEYPHLNASVSGEELIVHNYVDLGIAVDLDYEGLLAPVVRDAETKRLRAIAREISDLANRARARKLGPDEIQGGTFTISNNGSAGSVLTMPIINQPQVAIISTDAIVRKPVVVSGPGGGEAIAIHPVGHLAMSWDHRAFDGAYAANFLRRVKEILETRDWSAEL